MNKRDICRLELSIKTQPCPSCENGYITRDNEGIWCCDSCHYTDTSNNDCK